MGQPGARLLFAGRQEESTRGGKRLVCKHTDPTLNLSVESVYEVFDGVPVVRRYSRVTNLGSSPVGIEFLSSAMLHGLAAPQDYDRELRIHVALNSWMAEGQWHNVSALRDGLRRKRTHQLVGGTSRKHWQLVDGAVLADGNGRKTQSWA